MSSNAPYTPDTIKALRDCVRKCKTWLEAKAILVEETGRHPDNITRAHKKYCLWDNEHRDMSFDKEAPSNTTEAVEPPPSKGAHMSFKGDLGEVDVVDEMPRTLEELIKICKVDTSIWEVERYIINKWEMGRKDKTVNLVWTDGVMNGEVNDTGGITKAGLWQVKAWLRRKVEQTTLNAMLEEFSQRAAKHAPRKWVFEKACVKDRRDCCYVLNGQDLHIAKLAWAPETGSGDWDIRIAREAYDAAMDELMEKVPNDRVEEVVIIVGSDMLQVDNDKSTTTAGTYVDSDSRLAKAFQVAGEMLTDRIEKLASKFKVKVVVIPGNHDSTVSLFLGKYVEAWFRNHPNVKVDAAPRSRKYHGYGKTLIAFDHGDETKMKDLPLVVMQENRSTISQYKYTEVLTGHLHSEQCDDYKGIIVRTAPALCSPDRWHARRGYVGTIRRSQGLLYQREEGLQAIYYSKALD